MVLSGSHIDTVVNGGNLDGQFGALAAWLAIDWLKTQYGAPLRTLEVVAMAEEEGSRGNDSNLLIVFYVQIMPDDFVMQLHRF